MRAPHTFVRHFRKSKPPPSYGAVCVAHDLEDHDCPDWDIRLRTHPSWGDSGSTPVSVSWSGCSTTPMRVADVICHDDPNDFAGRSILPRPNPDWCNSNSAPVPASRGGCFDADINPSRPPSQDDLNPPEGVAPRLSDSKHLSPCPS
jgi:hypothetical protein